MSLIIEWLFPKNCLGCNKGEGYLCNLCESKMKNGILTHKEPFEGFISIYKYDGLIKEIVEKIKYNFISEAIDELAELMGKKLKINYPNVVQYWQKEGFCLIPIPLYWQRQNWRGFNQSEKLANKLAEILKLKTDNLVLKRRKKSINQATIKNRQIRQKNIQDVFQVNDGVKVPKNIILIDDVITSGATMTAAWKTLKSSGADLGWALSLCGAQR